MVEVFDSEQAEKNYSRLDDIAALEKKLQEGTFVVREGHFIKGLNENGIRRVVALSDSKRKRMEGALEYLLKYEEIEGELCQLRSPDEALKRPNFRIVEQIISRWKMGVVGSIESGALNEIEYVNSIALVKSFVERILEYKRKVQRQVYMRANVDQYYYDSEINSARGLVSQEMFTDEQVYQFPIFSSQSKRATGTMLTQLYAIGEGADISVTGERVYSPKRSNIPVRLAVFPFKAENTGVIPGAHFILRQNQRDLLHRQKNWQVDVSLSPRIMRLIVKQPINNLQLSMVGAQPE